ncbi:MAG: class I SAM-dependent methyltransferase [Acidimicrobiales bacterium]
MRWRYLWVVVAIATVINGVRLRIRANALSRIDGDATKTGDVAVNGHAKWRWLSCDGFELDEGYKEELIAYASSRGIAVIDVVPDSLATEQALDLLRSVSPKTYRQRCLAPGATALCAIGVRGDVADRAGVDEDSGMALAELWKAAARLKRYAPRDSDLVVVGAGSTEPTSKERLTYLKTRFGPGVAVVFSIPAVLYVFLGVGLVLYPLWGLVAIVAWCLQPIIALFGSPLDPGDLWTRSLLRWMKSPVDLAKVLMAHDSEDQQARDKALELEVQRAAYDELLAKGVDRFFEPARQDCPMCSSKLIRVLLTTTDLIQQKPGSFTVMVCDSCHHKFQNPRLSLVGLDFYYRDFYDGMGEDQLEFVFGATDSAYRGRAKMLEPHAEPTSWLDVGCGHGHFCLVAGEIWPDTRFDGLDMSESVEEAERRGWIDRGYRGLLLELAGQLKGRYDVVSMHHYLEHTREPLEELDAAIGALSPGGHLLIELPDPESRWRHILGRYWIPWFQPQHQHFISFSKLAELLGARGMTVVDTARGKSVQPVDLTCAVWFLANRIAPSPALPWRPQRGRLSGLWRLCVLGVTGPILALALVLDNVLAIAIRAGNRSNTYRILARKVVTE